MHDLVNDSNRQLLFVVSIGFFTLCFAFHILMPFASHVHCGWCRETMMALLSYMRLKPEI